MFLTGTGVSFCAQQAASKLQSGSVTSEQLTHATFEQISSTKPLNAYVTLCEEQALSQAQQSDKRRKEGMWISHIITVDCLGTNFAFYYSGKSRSIVDGVPISIKDNFCTEGFSYVFYICYKFILVVNIIFSFPVHN